MGTCYNLLVSNSQSGFPRGPHYGSSIIYGLLLTNKKGGKTKIGVNVSQARITGVSISSLKGQKWRSPDVKRAQENDVILRTIVFVHENTYAVHRSCLTMSQKNVTLFYICYNLVICHPIYPILRRNIPHEIFNKHSCTTHHPRFICSYCTL